MNLYMGNKPDRPRHMAVRPGPQWMELLLLPARDGARTKAEEQRFFARRVARYIRTQPLDFAAGLARKTVHLLSTREIPSNFDLYAARRDSRLFSLLTWKAGRFGFPFGVLLPLAVVGLFVLRRRIPVPMALFLVLYPAAIVLVFVTARYRAPVIPVLAVPAAAGLWAVVDNARRRRWLPLAAMAGAVAGVGVLASLAGPFAAETIDYEAETCFSLGSELQQQNQLDAAEAWYRKGLERDPHFSEAYNSLGRIRAEQGRLDDAADLYRKAIELAPQHYWYHYNLGSVLLQQGKIDEGIRHSLEAIRLSPYDSAHRLPGTASGRD
jgi:tetratricopeptide (TPR) repeat protein